MIFTKRDVTLRLLDVLEIKDKNIKKYNQARHFSAISIRRRSNAQISFHDQTLHMGQGSITYFPPDLDYTRVADQDDMIVIHFEAYNYHGNTVETYQTENFETLYSLFEKLYKTWTTAGRDRNYLATAQVYDLLACLVKDCALSAQIEPGVVSEAKRIMQAEYANPYLSIREIAAKMDISQEYLRRVFKEVEKISPKKYLQDLRIGWASSLLTSGYYSVKQVAEKCGFADEKYFSVVFKKNRGVQPSKYEYVFNG